MIRIILAAAIRWKNWPSTAFQRRWLQNTLQSGLKNISSFELCSGTITNQDLSISVLVFIQIDPPPLILISGVPDGQRKASLISSVLVLNYESLDTGNMMPEEDPLRRSPADLWIMSSQLNTASNIQAQFPCFRFHHFTHLVSILQDIHLHSEESLSCALLGTDCSSAISIIELITTINLKHDDLNHRS